MAHPPKLRTVEKGALLLTSMALAGMLLEMAMFWRGISMHAASPRPANASSGDCRRGARRC